MNDNISKLYDAMKNRGFNDLGTPDEFSNRLQDEGKRKKAYDALNKYGFNDLGTFDEFSNRVVIQPTEQPTSSPTPGTQLVATNENQTGKDPIVSVGTSVAPVQATQEGGTPMTEEQRQEALSRIQRMKENSERSMKQFNERMDTMLEYGSKTGMNYGNTAKGSIQHNPQTGNFEQTYITPTGERTFSKEVADFNSSQYRQVADMSVGGQLRKADKQREKIIEKMNIRGKELDKESLSFSWRDLPRGSGGAIHTYNSATVNGRQVDGEYLKLQAALAQLDERISTLKDEQARQKGENVGFWRGVGSVVGKLNTWDFGMSDITNASTLLGHGHNYSEREEEADKIMMEQAYLNQETQGNYGGNANFWNRAGVMTGHMVPFMIDFALTGGGFEGIKLFGKGGSKVATKVVGEEVVKEMAEQGFKTYVKNNGIKGFGQEATNWTIKALGTTADDLLVRAPLMTNTIQIGKTTSDIIDRKLGDVIIDENGNYDFSNHESWGSAIWQGEANAIIENYSEMFGAHLPDLGVRKIAETFGGKRLSGLLARADHSSFGKILDTTKKQLEKFGISDYFGEVTEEYYGQLWRTILNLDDAYQETPIVDTNGNIVRDENGKPLTERTNLLRSGQFHGDIWGGLALSMGLMGAGRYTVSAAGYGNMKHQVNRADKAATEILSPEIWEPLRETIDNTTNEDIGTLITSLLNDSEFSEKEKEATMAYVWNSMQLRGFNLGTIAEQRGNEQSEEEQALNESYLDGYDASSPQEMNDAKNMYEYQRKRAVEALGEELANLIDGNPVQQLLDMKNSGMYNENELSIVQDYANAKTLYNGMMQGIRDRIDDRIAQSNSMIDSHTNPDTGTIQTATMKQDDRKVYVIGGNLAMFDDGTIDREHSDESIILIDAETGKKEFTDPHSILSAESPINAEQQKQEAREAIQLQYAQEAANNIDGILPMNAGDIYNVSLDGENIKELTVEGPAVDENGMPIPDSFLVEIDGIPQNWTREEIQSASEAASLQRLNSFETERTVENEQNVQLEQQAVYEESRPEYILNDIVTLTAEDGTPVRGSITAEINEDGQIEVYTEQAINGKRINLFTPDELDSILINKNGEDIVIAPAAPVMEEITEETPDSTEIIEETVPEPEAEEQHQLSALERIPTDEKGKPIFGAVDAETAWDGLVEKTQDETTAQSFADNMVANKEAALKKAEKAKTKTTDDIDEFVEAENIRKAMIAEAQAELNHWKNIARTNKRRQEEAEAIRREEAKRISEEKRIQEEQERIEREEAERIEREALNGVPDWIKDTPQYARARGFRRSNSEKIDRQEPIESIKGKEVEVKFGEKDMPKGHVTVIEASQLQPSHSQGQRNPAFFLDEAQPKDRKDDVSIVSAQRIAENIRPEEITSSVTAYTGAPSVNTRGEVIQGNNRSDALKFMYDANKESAEKYKQYLFDHAEEFGLSTEDIAAMKNPVLVNMLDADDNEAIRLGQFVAQDTESGGIERIKPKNAIQKMGDKIRSFANILLSSHDEEMSFSELVDKNGVKTLQWMNQAGVISSTQYASAIDGKGNITGEAVNDLKSILYQSIFSGGSTSLEEMFNRMPAKAQKAILATAFRDYDSPNAERMVQELQQSIIAYNELSAYEPFFKAKNIEEVLRAVEAWKRQLTFDDVSGESYLPAEKFSNFALYLAAIYKGQTQKFIQQTFNDLYDVVQGTKEDTLFEEADKTPQPLVEAIRQVLDIEYQPIKQNDNGTNGSTHVAVDNQESTAERSGSDGDDISREQDTDGTEQTDDRGGAEDAGTGRTTTVTKEIAVAEAETETNPTEAQKEAGNYKKGHVKIHGFDISIEQPKGSIRSGVDPDGNAWSVTMNHTYGYIRGTKSRDNEQIDVFVGPNPESQKVFVVDQVNIDRSFDEHKVLIGFDSVEEAREAYLSNYEEGWQGLGNITETNIDSFRDWADMDGRRIKPFADYAMNQKQSFLNRFENILQDYTEDLRNEFEKNNTPYTEEELRSIAYDSISSNEESDLYMEAEQVLSDLIGKESYDKWYEANRANHNDTVAYLPDIINEINRVSNSQNIPVMTADEYLSANGASFMAGAEPALHKNIKDDKNKQRNIARVSEAMRENNERREELRKEYQKKVSRGEIRKPTREESLIKTANGHPDNEATQAARRVLDKRGIDWDEQSTANEPQPVLLTPNSTQGQFNWQHEVDHVSQMEITSEEKELREQVGYNTEEVGDVTFSERQLTEQGHLTFMGSPLTGRPKIKSSSDVAFLFKNLESAATENAFLVMIKEDGSYGVYYASTGGTTEVGVDMKLLFAAAKEYGAIKVCFVHNHPSGSLKPSRQDSNVHKNIVEAFRGSGIKAMQSVIINLDSGNYVEFDEHYDQIREKSKRKGKEIAPKIYQFDRQKLYVPVYKKKQIRSSADVAEFLSEQKRGAVPKIQILILDNALRVNKYMFVDPNLSVSELKEKIIHEVGKHGECVMLASNGALDSDYIGLLKEYIKPAGIRLLDVLEIKQDEDIINNYKSFADEGLMEPKLKYQKSSEKFKPISKPKLGKLISKLKKTELAKDVVVDKKAMQSYLEKHLGKETAERFMTLWHGSPHNFDKFSLSFMGTGEGNQAFGPGLYFTNNKEIAEYYASQLSAPKYVLMYKGKEASNTEQAAHSLFTLHGAESIEDAIRIAEENKNEFKDDSEIQKSYNDIISVLRNSKESDFEEVDVNKGVLYNVDTVDDLNLIEWYGELSPKQKDALIAGIESLPEYNNETGEGIDQQDKAMVIDTIRNSGLDGRQVQGTLEYLLGNGEDATYMEFMRNAGFHGVKYPSDSLSDRDSDSFNYVIFDEEVLDIKDKIRLMSTPSGEIYGFVTPDGTIYLNPDKMNANTPIHEFGHLWNSFIKENNPELYAKGAELIKESEYWSKVNNNPSYSSLSEEQKIDEALAMLIGDKGEAQYGKSDLMTFAGVKAWLHDIWGWIKQKIGISPKNNIEDMTLQDFTKLALSDILGGKKIEKTEKNTNFANNEESGTNTDQSGSEIPLGSTQEELRGMYENTFGTNLASRLREGTGGNSSQLSQHEREDLEKRITRDYAKENDVWVDDFYSLGSPMRGGGNENTLAVNPNNGYIYKANNLMNSNMLVSQLLKQVSAHNLIFPETAYEIEGITGVDFGGNSTPIVEPILKQKYVPNSVEATQQEIDGYMDELGFEKVNNTTFSNGEYIVSDLHPRNVLKDANGNIHVIDDIIRPAQPKVQEPPKMNVGEDLFEYARRVTEWNENKSRNSEEAEIRKQSVEKKETPSRDSAFSERDRVAARESYERMVSSGAYQFQEAVQDSMLGLKKTYQAILEEKTNIADVPGFENAYLAENRMSSVNAAEQRDYYGRFMRPLLEEIGRICGTDKAKRQALEDYMMAKHGLERNQVLAERDAKENDKDVSEYRNRDYAGLTALTGVEDVAEAEAIAEKMVADYESENETDKLWQMINAATGATLAKIYYGGLLSKESYEQISGMYQYYIPLQGFDEKTSDEVYGYMTSNQSPLIGAPIKRAEGRKSRADDPIATIAMMADTAIMKSNRNLMKQKFLNFVLNHPSDLISVSDLWLQYDEVSGEWEPIFPEISPNDSASEVDQKVTDFEEKMKELSENDDKYKRGKDIPNIPYRVINGNLSEHQVLVKRGGSTYVL
ncbi:hypothetical protein LJB98_03280, partial [Bacteroidales bacterium OttesenSCG-928-M11]|nr:hypothetical protein [Bacteroidales bacterium OttesenSCG-928-M11]